MATNDDLITLIVVMVLLIAVIGYLSSAVKIPKQWERMAVLRLGRFRAMMGPGLFVRIPGVDQVAATVDLRTTVHDIPKQRALTRDNVPVTVDALVYSRVKDPEASVLKVGNYSQAINGGAASMLRDSIGRRDLDDLLQKREEVQAELKRTLDKMTEPWGIEVEQVLITELWMSQDLEEAMAREASAVRERRARVQLAMAEKEIARTLVEAAATYESDPVALSIRSMNMLYEMCLTGKGTTIFVPTDTALQMRSPVGAFGIVGSLKGTPAGAARTDGATPASP
jgi:regulator of protease activity HflC (stomatin/prohibitin superfamily)